MERAHTLYLVIYVLGDTVPKDLELQRLPELEAERDESDIARTTSILSNLQKKYTQVSSELRGPVSAKYPESDTEQLESFAERIINENIAKQARPETVALHVRRYQAALAKAQTFDEALVPSKRVASEFPRTVFGTEAWIGLRYFPKTLRQGYLPRFVSKTLALPCVERTVRKEVLFAKGKGGRGYRKRHRRGVHSDIWC